MEFAGGACFALTVEGALVAESTSAVVLACSPRQAVVVHVQHEPDMSVASVFGKITQLAGSVSFDEEMSGRTESTEVVGYGCLDFVLGAIATL
jgi:hypothetical protein